MTINIVKYNPVDHSQMLLKFYNGLSNEDRYKRFHGYVKNFKEYLDSLKYREGIILLALHNGRIVGVCEAYKVDKDEWEVAIIVSRNYRRRGIGKKLLEKVAKEVDNRGGKGLYGIVGRDNYEAIEFGKRVGCKVMENDIYTVKIYFELCGISE